MGKPVFYICEISFAVTVKLIRPKLKFYLFPLSRPTLKKRPYPKYFISIFSHDFFLNFIANCQREFSNVKSAIYLKFFFLVIVKPILGLFTIRFNGYAI